MQVGLKARRILPKSKKTIWGMRPNQILERFSADFPNHKYQRLYLVPGKKEAVVIKAVLPSKQLLFNVKKTGANVEFEPAGIFSHGFAHRDIFGVPRGKGLGTIALNTELALARKKGMSEHHINSNQKSTTLMLLKRGYKLAPGINRSAIEATGIKNEKELLALLTKSTTPEQMNHDWHLAKSIKPARK